MKAQELINSIKRAEADTDNWYASREVGLFDLYGDLMDGLEEEYIEGITVSKPSNGKLRVKCEDGTVWIHWGFRELTYNIIPDHKHTDIPVSHPRSCMSHYERTRAMVYATGNKWAIENFNATHC